MTVHTLDDGIVTSETIGALAARSLLGRFSDSTGALEVLSAADTPGLVPKTQVDGTVLWEAEAGGAPLSDASPQAVGTAAAGAGTSASRDDHVHAHGNQTSSNTMHAVAVAAGNAGFMSGADKTKLDGVAASAAALTSSTPAAIGTAAVGVATTAARADHVHNISGMTDNQLVKGTSAGGIQTLAAGSEGVPLIISSGAPAYAKVGLLGSALYLGQFTATAANDWDFALPSGFRFNDVNGYRMRLRASAASAAFFDVLLDGTDTCDETNSLLLLDANTLGTGGVSDGPGVVSATAGNVLDLLFWSDNGFERWVKVNSHGLYSGSKRHYVNSGRWVDTTTNFATIRLRLDGGVLWTAGSLGSLWCF
jgi:hypothetical protein